MTSAVVPATIQDTGKRHPALVKLYLHEWRMRGYSTPPVRSYPKGPQREIVKIRRKLATLTHRAVWTETTLPHERHAPCPA